MIASQAAQTHPAGAMPPQRLRCTATPHTRSPITHQFVPSSFIIVAYIL